MYDLDREEQLELELEIKRCELEYLNEIKERLIELLQEAIQEKIYDISDPIMTWWERTNDFKNSVDIKLIDNDKIFIYPNLEKMNYYSYVNFQKTDNEVSQYLPSWLEYGHHSNNENQYGLYKDYNGRYYLESAINKMKSEFPGLNFEIIVEN